MQRKNNPRAFRCYFCDAPITFDKAIRSANNKPIPLNVTDRSKHDCPKSPYNLKKKLGSQKPEAAS